MQTQSIRRARVDDRRLCDLTESVTGAYAIAIAHDLGMFQALHEGPRTIEEVRAAVKLDRRPCEMLLAVCAGAGCVSLAQGRYALTPFAEDYLCEESPLYAGGLFRLWSDREAPFSIESLRRALIRSDDEAADDRWVDQHLLDESRARSFTTMMHGHSMAAALAWPDRVDLGAHTRLLDVGGGSGAHAIGALLRWPRLQATVMDIQSVCRVAKEYILQYGMQDRIQTAAADFWCDSWPEADVHFFSDVFHNWTGGECTTLACRSFEQLPVGGRIIVHEMLLDDERTGPFTVAASAVGMLTWCRGQQYTAAEIEFMLRDAGFQSVEIVPTFGYWSIIVGRKP